MVSTGCAAIFPLLPMGRQSSHFSLGTCCYSPNAAPGIAPALLPFRKALGPCSRELPPGQCASSCGWGQVTCRHLPAASAVMFQGHRALGCGSERRKQHHPASHLDLHPQPAPHLPQFGLCLRELLPQQLAAGCQNWWQDLPSSCQRGFTTQHWQPGLGHWGATKEPPHAHEPQKQQQQCPAALSQTQQVTGEMGDGERVGGGASQFRTKRPCFKGGTHSQTDQDLFIQ